MIILLIFTIPIIYFISRQRKIIGQLITNWISRKIIEMHHTHYVINYPFGVSWYKIIVPRKRGPSDISRILKLNETTEITDEIKPFLGPYNNFHGTSTITPTMCGYPNGIIIEDLFFFNKKEIQGDEIIVMK